MTDLFKTLIFAAVALVLTGAAFVTTRDRTIRSDVFNDQGQPFYPDFKDPLECTDLEVVDYDAQLAEPIRFRVMLKNNRWVIPSHHDYPADARDRLSKTAAAVMDLIKDTIRSDRPEDYEAMNVIDPLDTKATTLKGRGKRITLRNSAEKVLADFIIGSEIKGSTSKGADSKDQTTQHYVRIPDTKRVYGVRLKAEPSARFADWIETNLLKLDASHVRKVVFDNHKVSLEQGIEQGPIVTIERKDSSSPWTMEGMPADKELDADKLRAMADALADLKIVGVRVKPAGVTRELKRSGDKNFEFPKNVLQGLAAKGFFPTRDGQMLSNQGDVKVYTDEGVVYTLRFGELAFGTGAELTSGESEDKADSAEGKAKEAPKKDQGAAENRYVMVTASYDPALIGKPKPEEDDPKPITPPGTIPAKPFATDPNDPAVVAKAKAKKERAEQAQKDYEKKLADGKKKADELTDRFGPWYYVTPGDSFRSIKVDPVALLQPKKAPGGEGSMPSGFPSGGGLPGGGLPPGLPPIQP
ncbi:hypothetical protein OJF2_49360 [Aquisphaera giovannonii]|uniref:DUF4340 domain-containing protein n=1 Tax=Aquisphaera giovannonii TaxID=406548 RepID=A0A5B9W815_9BACT|nr:DUF4340 domain-containing protein [Aquisphaera giovannonii]QEH36374.1 hypothetical protein OJF2_49360 [Aquisphaera giovannonii]